ncbi:hypothetical protein SAMN02799631_00020 [Methylobacterium sp. 174MFSha1.1]|uniref:hypothetical protein n=1 Tax=Methylobacterium sp. 174MFSha1.1 TaxID=1502749 RepID=UPI0008F1BC63|nr:hypothetical protein [Methylobacterium sp. 174MFSha1.1]SFU30354.1 hypothetical protein SAMN02799631_00020 [Methylobacterium sp. 174MFSha1.1]
MLRKPSLSPRALLLGSLALLALAGSAAASPRDSRVEACTRARGDGERQALGCWRLRDEAGRGQRIHGGAAVADFYATVPAEREAAESKAAQRRRDWVRARARGRVAGDDGGR